MRAFFCLNKEERRIRNCPKTLHTKECLPLSSLHKASLTVETAFVLPLFLFTMLVFLYLLCFWQGYEKIQQGLTQAVKKSSQEERLEKGSFYEYLEKNGGNFSYISGGKEAISLATSYISPFDEEIRLCAVYRVRFPVPFLANGGIRIKQTAVGRLFTGVTFWGSSDSVTDREIVYVTEYGTVYHRHRSCTYLNPTIHACSADEVFRLRNNNGGKYKPCSVCMKQRNSWEKTYYITEEGDSFHSTTGCRSLKRTIREVPFSMVQGMPPCTKCGG